MLLVGMKTLNQYMSKINGKFLSRILKLYSEQPWLILKEKELLNILENCPTQQYQELIFELLINFNYITSDKFIEYQNKIVDYITLESGFNINQTQLVATAYDKEADSSQSILHSLKLSLTRKNWGTVQTVNNIGNCIKTFNKYGLNQIILIDEFVGSGSTIKTRIEYIRKNIKGEFTIKCCFLAGISFGINRIINECNVEVFCPLILNRGITESFPLSIAKQQQALMIELEKKECYKIIEENLMIYSLGYNQAEALYSAEGISMNTPNSVFPIFWWPLDSKGKKSQRILSRFEKELYETLGI